MNSLQDIRCVVLGAGGFIGTNLCRMLLPQASLVRGFGRRRAFPDALRGVEWMSGDFSDPTSVAAAIAGCDTVFHLINATTPASANVDKLADLQANVASTLRLLDACREEGVKRIVFVSSGGTIYGVPSQIPTPESAPTSPITAYGISKLSIEKYLALYEYLYGIEHRILRVANPFGPYQTAQKHQGVIAAFMHQCVTRQPIQIWGDGQVVRDYIYVQDVAAALVSAATHIGPSRIFNIGSGEGRSLLEIISAIEEVSGVTPSMRFSPGRTVDVPRSILDTSLAAKELAWKPATPFMDGMRQTWNWISQRPDVRAGE
ncbi:NAD-dependent epimerase/dehydratase family protein [Achromobacter denitrificans]|uniref:NAD-dependent epimerase/dehydratase family protein n=1 Tax=Achromobacter denitrificans TaxID=32002 RepID=UPI002798ECE2|nr:NAD-dependent epimerase/dehydratase family protein [Achromobacter denitrificans]